MTRIYEAFIGWVSGLLFPDDMWLHVKLTDDDDDWIEL